MRDIQRIFIHCTAGSQKQTLKDLLNEFKQKGWKNPGYHYAIFPDGSIENLLSEDQVSNGVQGYNSTSINIAYVGGIDSKGRATDNRTEAQKLALIELLTRLKNKYPNAHIMGHRDIWGKNPAKWKKQCPCFDAEKEYAYMDDFKLNKYEDSGADPIPEDTELYIFDKPRDWTGLMEKMMPWK